MKVAKVINNHTVAITSAGGDVHVGAILSIGGYDVTDPETGEHIGTVEGLPVKVTDVYQRFCVAETYRLSKGNDRHVVVNIGDPVTALGGTA